MKNRNTAGCSWKGNFAFATGLVLQVWLRIMFSINTTNVFNQLCIVNNQKKATIMNWQTNNYSTSRWEFKIMAEATEPSLWAQQRKEKVIFTGGIPNITLKSRTPMFSKAPSWLWNESSEFSSKILLSPSTSPKKIRLRLLKLFQCYYLMHPKASSESDKKLTAQVCQILSRGQNED